jgi:branched-chain amino acid aminotransferase
MQSFVLAVKVPINKPAFELGQEFKTLKSLDRASALLPQGAYTTFRTYHKNYALHLEDHFLRLDQSAKLLGVSIDLDPARVRDAIRESLQQLDGDDFRIRISVDLELEKGAVYILVENLRLPSQEAYRNGVNVLLRPFERENPQAKATRFIQNSNQYRRLISKDINEVLLSNSNEEILEGLSSNFYAVIANALFTAEEGILPGITRKIVLEEAVSHQIPLLRKPVKLKELNQVQEAFLTSTSRAILPVRKIGKCVIGSGAPGPVTESISRYYQARVASELEEI